MKQIIKKINFFVLIFASIFLFCDNVDAACTDTDVNDGCETVQYTYDYAGQRLEHYIILDWLPYLDTLGNPKADIYIYNKCQYYSPDSEVYNRYCSITTSIVATGQTIDVPYKNATPIAVCAVTNDSNILPNLRKYIYFSEKEVKTAIDNNVCKSVNIFYSKEYADAKLNKDNFNHLVVNFYSDTDWTNANVSVTNHSVGQNYICNFKISKNGNSDEIILRDQISECNTNNIISCNLVGSTAHLQTKQYACNIYAHKDGNYTTIEDDKQVVGKECILRNTNDKNDAIVYFYGDEQAFKQLGYAYKTGLEFSDLIFKGEEIKKENLVLAGYSYTGTPTYTWTHSCPTYIFYNSDENKYLIGGTSDDYSGKNGILYSMNNSNDEENLDFDDFDDVFDDYYNPVTGVLLQGCEFLSNDLKDKLNLVLNIIKILGPVLAILLGMFDFVKVIASGDADKEMKNAWNRLKIRLIAAALLFLIPIILSMLINLFIGDEVNDNPFCDLLTTEESSE